MHIINIPENQYRLRFLTEILEKKTTPNNSFDFLSEMQSGLLDIRSRNVPLSTIENLETRVARIFIKEQEYRSSFYFLYAYNVSSAIANGRIWGCGSAYSTLYLAGQLKDTLRVALLGERFRSGLEDELSKRIREIAEKKQKLLINLVEEFQKSIQTFPEPQTQTDLSEAIKQASDLREFWRKSKIDARLGIGKVTIFYNAKTNQVSFCIEKKLIIDLDTLKKTIILKKAVDFFYNLHCYVIENKKKLIKVARSNNNNIYIRPKDSGLKRALQFTQDGRVFIHLNRQKLNDTLLGRGALKKVTIAIELVSGKAFASASYNTKRNENELIYLHFFKKKPGFVQLIEHVEYNTKKTDFSGTVQKKTRLILDLYSGDLIDILEKKKSISLENKKNIFENIVNAVALMHKSDLIHRDIKPDNILCKTNSNGLIEAVIADMENMCHVEDTEQLNQRCGTKCYVSPEYAKALLNQSSLATVTTKACDIWALGLTLHAVLFNDLGMFKEDPSWSTKDLISHISTLKDQPEPINTSSPKHLIWRMLQINPEKRITAKDAQERLKDIRWI